MMIHFCLMKSSGDVVQLVEHQTSMLLMQVRFPCAARDFSVSQLSVQTLLQHLCTPLCNRTH